MTLKDKVLSYLPNKYKDRLGDIEQADDLIDGCKYIVYTSDDYEFEDDGNSLPCRSIGEVIYFIKNSTIPKSR